MKLYRFRSMDYLLGNEYQELEKQTIYFASPDQLNDPMEGFRDIVWRGDKIVWTNFIKHYIYCLVVCYFLFTITRESEEFDVDKIPIPDRWDQPPNPHIQRLFDDIWRKFLNLPNIREIIEALGNTDRKIGYGEIELLLLAIQSIFIVENKELYFQHGIIPESDMQQLAAGLLAAQKWSELILKSLLEIEESDTGEIDNYTDRTIASLINNYRLNHLLNYSNSSVQLAKNALIMILDFPKKYLNEIERLLWPNWYAACFMKDCHNSSVWSHYGDQHRGVCLMFESVNTGESNCLKLNRMKSKSERRMPFREVSYAAKPGKVNFFRCIGGLLTEEGQRQLWYTDKGGNISECAPHLLPEGDMDTWQKNYWNGFYHNITTKSKDWKYEQEYRLILHNMLNEYNEEEDRTLTYDFNSLKGIIFGIKTSDEDKLRIIEIIRRKCEDNSRESFTFFQAYYSPADGGIRKDEMQMRLVSHVGTVASDRLEN